MRPAGFTLWELLLTLAVAGVACSLAGPELRNVVLDSRRGTDVSAFVLAVQLARSESAKRAQPVVLCFSEDQARCSDRGSGEQGWIVFVNEDDERPAQRSDEEPLLLAHVPTLAGSIASNREAYEFRPFRKRSTNGTVTFCDTRGAAGARAVIVSYTGRPRVSQRDSSGRALACPEAS